MRQIPLTQNKYALIDDDDFDKITQFLWFPNKNGRKLRAITPRTRGAKFLYMHQLIMNGKNIDHINGNSLDNRKANLRFCTNQQNQANELISKNNTSGFKGVIYCKPSSWPKLNKRWLAQIKVNYKTKKCGYFLTKEEPARAYDAAAIKYFGEFANLNFK